MQAFIFFAVRCKIGTLRRELRCKRGAYGDIYQDTFRTATQCLAGVVKLALHTGMRSNELLTLTRDQVDINRGVVRLSDTKNGSSRTVPLSPPARAIFQEALDHPIRPIDCNLIFFGEPGKDGKRRPYQFRKLWADMLKKLGISDLHFHDLRHEAVSRLVEAGLTDQEVASISGHKSMQMLRRYTHLRAEDLVAKLEKAVLR